jgi:hypothetical protein
MEHYFAHIGWPIFDMMMVTRRSRDYVVPAARQAGAELVRHIEAERAS